MPRKNKRQRRALKNKRQANKLVLSHNLATELGDTPRETGIRTATSRLNRAAEMHAHDSTDWRTIRHETAPPDWRKTYKRFGSK